MAQTTGRIMWFAPGVSIYGTCDNDAETVSDITVDNDSEEPVTIMFTVRGRTRTVTIPAAAKATHIPPIGPPPSPGDSVQISGVI